jgi:hypothetical protein
LEAALVKNLSLEVEAFYHPIKVSRRSVLTGRDVIDLFSGTEGRTWIRYPGSPRRKRWGLAVGELARQWRS